MARNNRHDTMPGTTDTQDQGPSFDLVAWAGTMFNRVGKKGTAIGVGAIAAILAGCGPTATPALAEKAPAPASAPANPGAPIETATPNSASTPEVTASNEQLSGTELPWGGPESGKYDSIKDYPFKNPETGEPMTLEEIDAYFTFPTAKYGMTEAQRALVKKLDALIGAGISKEEAQGPDVPTFQDESTQLGGGVLASNVIYVERMLYGLTGKSLSELALEDTDETGAISLGRIIQSATADRVVGGIEDNELKDSGMTPLAPNPKIMSRVSYFNGVTASPFNLTITWGKDPAGEKWLATDIAVDIPKPIDK